MDEEGLFCDFEILSDGISSYFGLSLAIARDRAYPDDICNILEWLAEMSLHVNGSLRGKLAVEQKDLDRLYEIYYFYKDKIQIEGFTLPVGSYLSCHLNVLRYKTKELVRLLHKIDQQQEKVPKILFSFTNLLANFLYVLSCYINFLDRMENKPFISKSYR
ncbi:hypothetical protein [Tepidimicrobium xylanilyticum]